MPNNQKAQTTEVFADFARMGTHEGLPGESIPLGRVADYPELASWEGQIVPLSDGLDLAGEGRIMRRMAPAGEFWYAVEVHNVHDLLGQ